MIYMSNCVLPVMQQLRKLPFVFFKPHMSDIFAAVPPERDAHHRNVQEDRLHVPPEPVRTWSPPAYQDHYPRHHLLPPPPFRSAAGCPDDHVIEQRPDRK